MQYIGAKARVAKELASVISSHCGEAYWEPFVGAANVIQLVECPTRIGTDIDRHIISYLQMLQTGWLPPSQVSEEEYEIWRQAVPSTTEEFAMKAAIGYGCSFGGKFFGGYARSGDRNYALNAYNAAVKQAKLLSGIQFGHQSYDISVPDGVDTIYCDPPYKNTTGCGTRASFDSDKFWSWCLDKAMEGLTVLVTEFTAPEFATEIWSKEKYTDMRRSDQNLVMTERLFKIDW